MYFPAFHFHSKFLPLCAKRTLSNALGVLSLRAAIDVRGGRQRHGHGAHLAQAILDEGDFFEGWAMTCLGGGTSVGRHKYFWEQVMTCRVCVRVGVGGCVER